MFRKQNQQINMIQEEIVGIALENLQKTTQIEGNWTESRVALLDGQLQMSIENELFLFNVEVKQEIRNTILPQLIKYNQLYAPFMVIAYRLSANVKEQLRENKIAYLEANGNLFLKENGKWFWLDNNPSLKIEQNDRNRAFTKTGLRVVFEFLQNPPLINLPYRQIAEQTGTSIGNITHIVNGLKQDGFLLPLTKKEYVLKRKEDLLNRWISAYERTLKPTLRIGTFRFLDEGDFSNWKDVALLPDKTQWGGESAGDLITHHLRPAALTLYTSETRKELVKNYRLIPDPKGNVQVFKSFWLNKNESLEWPAHVVPPLLTYADLINIGDKRSRETAHLIYDQYLQPYL
jgi:hypothetical protein